ncbi:hypothetical protein BN961_00758 [Afipia felis]|uniref:Uncharacterized protein n=1 Tax=Afipia felis TaxID=1035 RepID=A0A090MP22_AFIFE|nr:hypothetical protein BN961_00758 [Afipia felis]
MDIVGARIRDQFRDPRRAGNGDTQIRITWQRDSGEGLRREKRHIDAEIARRIRHHRQRADDAIDLRVPGVGRDQNPHQAACAAMAGEGAACRSGAVHVRISNRPS